MQAVGGLALCLRAASRRDPSGCGVCQCALGRQPALQRDSHHPYISSARLMAAAAAAAATAAASQQSFSLSLSLDIPAALPHCPPTAGRVLHIAHTGLGVTGSGLWSIERKHRGTLAMSEAALTSYFSVHLSCLSVRIVPIFITIIFAPTAIKWVHCVITKLLK